LEVGGVKMVHLEKLVITFKHFKNLEDFRELAQEVVDLATVPDYFELKV